MPADGTGASERLSGGQLWRAALSQPGPTALLQAAPKLLERPEAGLGHSRPAQRAGNHLSPATEVGLLRPQRRGTPQKKWVDFGLKLLRATTTHSDGPQRLKMTALA